jgi:hypothetical protein
MEQVGAIDVEAFAVVIEGIKGIASDVGPSVDHPYAETRLRQLAGHDGASKASTDHEHSR